MLTHNLFDTVLIRPATENGFDTLNIVSGYASPAMVNRHFQELIKQDMSVNVNLIIGMTHGSGMSKNMHNAFVTATDKYKFKCSYIYKGNLVHAKVYSWKYKDLPQMAFAGSANYSMMGFGESQTEIVNHCDIHLANRFYDQISKNAMSCTDRSIVETIDLTEEVETKHVQVKDSVELSLLDSRTQKTHKRAGLNWGQRSSRNPDQAYIPIPSSVYKSSFFPPAKRPFLVHTDDGEKYTFVRAQENGKALHTTHDNSLLGLYFRSRIGVTSGEFVKRQDLENYGRTTVRISKINDREYFLDFSTSLKQESNFLK